MSNRAQEFLSSIPICSRTIIGINILVHIIIFLTSASLNKFAISGALVIYEGEYYRIVSATFVHGGIMHIAMNMSSMLQLGPSLEHQFGSLAFLFLTLWSIFICGLLYCGLGWLAALILQDPGQLMQMGVGYSGILFCYAVVESYHTTETVRSVFGMFNVPARVFPFILLIILQVVIPGISFLGHLSGVIVGLLVVSGMMNCVLPSTGFLQWLDAKCSCLRGPSFIWSPNKGFMHESFSRGGSTACAAIAVGCGYLCVGLLYIWYMLATLLHVVGVPVHRIEACAQTAYARVVGCWRYFLETASSARQATVAVAASASSSASSTAAAAAAAASAASAVAAAAVAVPTQPVDEPGPDTVTLHVRDRRGHYQSVQTREEETMGDQRPETEMPPLTSQRKGSADQEDPTEVVV